MSKSGCKSKRKVTLAKDLGLKGKARYLLTFDTSPIPDFADLDEKMKDAVLCAWSARKESDGRCSAWLGTSSQ